MDTLDVATILERAADIMQERGKASGWPGYSNGGPICSLKAIALGAGVRRINDLPIKHPAFLAMRRFTGGTVGWSDHNDAPTVIAGLRTVAAIERARAARMLPVVVEREVAHG